MRDLKERGLWDEVMVADLKYFDGMLSRIDRIPADLRAIYATAFEVDPTWLVEAASRRQKWIDQAQSLNIYMGGASGKKLDEVYKLAWLRGLKTTYYLRTMAATHVEKSTVAHGALNAVPTGGGSSSGARKARLAASVRQAAMRRRARSTRHRHSHRSRQMVRCARCVRAILASTNAKRASNAARLT